MSMDDELRAEFYAAALEGLPDRVAWLTDLYQREFRRLLPYASTDIIREAAMVAAIKAELKLRDCSPL